MYEKKERRCPNETCTLFNSKTPPVWDYFDPEVCEILFIAEAPGEDETNVGRPLVGMAGRVLFQALHHNRLTTIANKENAYTYTNGLNLSPLATIGFANVCHCRPAGNRTPSYTECQACSAYLAETISSCKRLRALVLLGDTPLHYLLNELHITKRRGMPTTLFDLPCVPTIHPAACLPFRSPELFDLLAKDIGKAVRLARDGWKVPELIVEDITPEAVDELKATGFAFDIETTSLSPSHGDIIGIAFSNAYGKAWHAWRTSPSQWALAKELLEYKEAFTVAQGNSFDVPYLRLNSDVDIENVSFDTSYGQKLIDPDLPATLAHIMSLYSDEPYYKGQRDELLSGRLTSQQIKEYCGRDASNTWYAVSAIKEQLHEYDMEKVFYSIIMPSSRTANRMQIKGVRLDISRQEKLKTEINSHIKEWREMFDSYGYNIDSPKQVIELLNKVGVKIKDTDAKTIEKAIHRYDHPLLHLIQEYRPWRKMEGTLYGKEGDRGLFNQTDETGIVHTRFKPNGTANSRWSSSNPNLQNIPEELRYIFIPTSDDLNFMQADYARLELHVAANLSQDWDFLKAVESTSIHVELAKEFYGENYTPKQKLLAKTIIFGTIYGRSARSISMDFGITVSEAESLQHRIAGRYPLLVNYALKNLNKLKQQGYLTSVFGRRRYFLSGNIESDAANYPVQTAAGDINNVSCILLDNAGLDLRLAVHDSCVIQYPKGEEKEYAHRLREIMERPIPEINNYGFKVEIKYGPNWKDMEVYHE